MADGGTLTEESGEPRPTIRSVLRTADLAPTFLLSLIARLPFGGTVLLVLLRVSPEHGYTAAGAVDALYAASLAIGQPLASRAVDRFGQTVVLVPLSLLGGAATAAIGLLDADAPIVWFGVLSIVNGLLQPPLGGAMRGVWDQLLKTEQERHVGYSVDAIASEVIWTIGPLAIVGIFATAVGVPEALTLCGLLTAVGGVAFAATRPSRAYHAQTSEHHGGVIGALRSPGVVTVFLASIAAGGHFGAIELGLTAFARSSGDNGLVGLLFAAWSAGSFVAGLAFSRVPAASRPARRLAAILFAFSAFSGLYAIAGSTAALAAALVIGGTVIAPFFVTLNATVGTVTADGGLTEVYSLTTTGITTGAMIAAPAAGALADHVSSSAAMGFAGVLPLLGAAIVWARRGGIGAAAPSTGAGERELAV